MTRESGQPLIKMVHIEKTGGTTVSNALVQLLGPEYVCRYITPTGKFIRVADERVMLTHPLANKLKELIAVSQFRPFLTKLYRLTTSGFLRPTVFSVSELPPETKAIYGHFLASIGDGQLYNPVLAVVLRDPLGRMISHYTNHKRSKGVSEWRVPVRYSEDMSFQEFALLPELQNYQTQALGGKSLSDFALVGVAERLADYLSQMQGLFLELGLISERDQFCLNSLNVTPRKPTFELSPAFLEKFQNFHREDYCQYELAKEISAHNK